MARGAVLLAMVWYSVLWRSEGDGSASVCKLQCHCSKNNTVVNCAGRKLNRLPVFPKHLERLVFDDNILHSLDSKAFEAYSRLKNVSLKNNQISEIAPDAFKGVLSLQKLFLDNNSLSNLTENMFSDLQGLAHLSFANNKFESLSSLSAAFGDVPNLEDLDMSLNNLSSVTKLPDGFKKLTGLKKLNLRATGIHNISADFFEALSDASLLRYMDLEDNPIEFVDTMAFKAIQNIKKLDLSNTNLSEASVGAALNGLQNSSIHILYLQYAFGKDTKLARSPFHHLNHSHLEVLDMQGNFDGLNGIIHHEFFQPLQHLEELYLNDCGLRRIYSRAFSGLKNLATLDLSNNSITCLKNTCAFLHHGSTLKSLKDLDLSSNNIGSNQATFSISSTVVPKLRTLKLNKNKISILSRDIFKGLRSLRVLDLSGNPLMVIEPNSFIDMSTLHHLSITDCTRLVALANDTFLGLSKLEALHLSHNSLQDIASGAFNGLKSIERLDMRHNFLSNFGSQHHTATIDGRHLNYLDIGYNNLQSIPASLLVRKANIRVLYLDYNRLSDTCINDSILPLLTGLHTLDLSFNSLLNPNVDCLVDNLGNLSTINLTGNPFYCSCNSLPSRGKLETLIAPEHKAGHVCVGPAGNKGTNIFDFKPSDWDCQLKYVIAPILGVFVTLIVGLMFCAFYVVLKRRQLKSVPAAESSTSDGCCLDLQSFTNCRRGSGPGLDPNYVHIDDTELSIRAPNGNLHSNPRTNGVPRGTIDVSKDTDSLVKDVEESNCDADRNGDL